MHRLIRSWLLLASAACDGLWPRPVGSLLDYSAEQVNASAALWNVSLTENGIARKAAIALQVEHSAAMWACADAIPGKLTSTGAWCLTHRVAGARGVVSFPDTGISYPIPAHHQPASQRIVHALSKLLRKPINGTSRSTYLSLNDFGAGVGQYGAALKAIDTSFRWRGYDGAGNVENWTKGMVNWFDLTIPLSLPRADWVLALEVAEHVPRRQEGIMVRNLHAHNCMGIIISWAVPGQVGHGHVNLRTSGYVIQRFESLGYAYDAELTKSLRHGSADDGSSRMHSHPWFLRSLLAFRRIQRVRSLGCFWSDWRN